MVAWRSFVAAALFLGVTSVDGLLDDDDSDAILDSVTYQRFKTFQTRFHVNCQNGTTDCQRRKRNFSANSRLLNSFANKDTETGYTVNVNRFMDWSPDDMKKLFMNDKIFPQRSVSSISGEELLRLRTKRAAGNFDWRTTGAVNPIRDQANCGSCWAFAAVAAIEIQSNYKNNRTGAKRRSYSEQYLVDCSTKNGCDGYYPELTMKYVQQKGIPRGASYKYVGREQKCPAKPTVDRPVASVVDFTGKPFQMMQYIQNSGPVAACFSVCNDFMFYGDGIYTKDCLESDPSYLGGHAVAVIGFGTTVNGVDYWLCRNQWGTGWGINGYFKIKRGLDLSYFESWEVSAPKVTIIP